MLTTKKKTPALTTSQQLASILKSARDIMRKDKGLSGDADRIPMLTWIMFLKFLLLEFSLLFKFFLEQQNSFARFQECLSAL